MCTADCAASGLIGSGLALVPPLKCGQDAVEACEVTPEALGTAVPSEFACIVARVCEKWLTGWINLNLLSLMGL